MSDQERGTEGGSWLQAKLCAKWGNILGSIATLLFFGLLGFGIYLYRKHCGRRDPNTGLRVNRRRGNSAGGQIRPRYGLEETYEF